MKVLSLRRTLVYMIMAGYVALLLLLSCMDYYLMVEHKERIRQQRASVIEDYMDKTAESMNRVRRILYNVGTSNPNFIALSGELSEVEKYSNAFELCETLENQMLMEEKLQGFYLFYGAEGVPMYKVDIGKIPSEHASRIGSSLTLSDNSAIKDKFGRWFHLTIDECTYISISYKKGNAVLYGIIALKDAEEIFTEELKCNTKVVVEADGRAETHHELAKELEISTWTQQSRDKFSFQKKKYSIYGEKIKNTSIWMCPVIENRLGDFVTIQQIMLLILTVFSFFLVVRMITFVNRQLVRPLNRLRAEMEEIRKGTSKNVTEMDVRFQELREMLDTLKNMIVELEKQRLIAYDTYIEKQKAQLQYLQLQLQPHFYLNNLKMINALAAEGQKEKIQTVIIRLSEHLRYLLQSEKETTTIKKEIDFVNNYVMLQNEMWCRQVLVEFQMDHGLDEWEIPTLTLQTFVENSIKYAKLGNCREVLQIIIAVNLLNTENGKFIDIQVRDNGQGYPEDILEDINEKTRVGQRHVGINNLKRRCQILYGERAEFSFYNMQGAVSECIIPKGVKL